MLPNISLVLLQTSQVDLNLHKTCEKTEFWIVRLLGPSGEFKNVAGEDIAWKEDTRGLR